MSKPAMSLVVAERADTAPAFKLDEFLPYRLTLCAASVSAALSQIYSERHRLGMPEWRVIVILGEFGHMTAKDVGVRGQMHKTKVSRAVAELERRRFLTRRANAADLREAILSLTPEGRAVYDDLAPRALQFADRLIATIDPCDREAFGRVLKQLMERSGAIADDIAKTGNPG